MGEPAAGSSYSVRFRHTQGDVGPLQFAPSTSVGELKERLYREWPSGELGRAWAIAQRAPRPAGWGGRASGACVGCCSSSGSSRGVRWGGGRRGMLPPPAPRRDVSALQPRAEGALGRDRPGSPSELRLICSGRFLDNGTTLGSERFAGVWGGRGVLRSRARVAALRSLTPPLTLPRVPPPPADLAGLVGEPAPDLVVTLHAVVRPPAAGKAAGAWVGGCVGEGGAGTRAARCLRLVPPPVCHHTCLPGTPAPLPAGSKADADHAKSGCCAIC